MATFTCKDGHTWTVREIDNYDRDKLLELCGVDILDEKDSGRLEACGALMSTDVWKNPLSYLLAEQLADRGMTASQIRLTGKQAAAAREAVLDEFQAFFQGTSMLFGELFQQLRDGGQAEINRRMIALTVGKVETMDLSALDSKLSDFIDAAIAADAKTRPILPDKSTS